MTHALIVCAEPKAIAFLRERYLGWSWEITDDPDRAIELLAKEPFDRLFLAHWLGKEPKNGRDVAIFLGTHPDVNPRIEVFSITDDMHKGRQTIEECKRLAYHVPMNVLMALGA